MIESHLLPAFMLFVFCSGLVVFLTLVVTIATRLAYRAECRRIERETRP